MSQPGRIVAVVLAGGEGRRMGGAKPVQSFGESTLIARAVELARGYAGRVAVAVRSADQAEPAPSALLLLDDPSIGGPLAGLASALAFAAEEDADAVLTLPCDMPHLPADLAQRLDAALEDGVGAAVASGAGQLHPTCALWRTSARARLAEYLLTGRSSLWGFAEHVGMAAVEWDRAAAFAGANTPEELAALQFKGR